MPGRELPASLREVLRRARDLEAVARSGGQSRAAVAARSVLLLAAYEAGLSQAELAAFLRMNHQTVQKRIATARSIYARERRQWLTLAEAAQHVGRDQWTIRNWVARGVLPNTDTRGGGVHLYLLADLDRVLAGPFRGPRGKYPDFEQLLEQIAAAPV